VGARLGFTLADHGRFCLGHYKVHSASSRDHILCPASAPAVNGKQCERCFVLDDSRLIHDFHRGGRVPDGLAQQVRSAAKAEALAGPMPAAALDCINSAHAAAVRILLGQAAVEGFSIVDELWVRPAQAAGLCAPTARHAYPHPLEQGKHGFGITALSGTNALAGLAGTDAAFVVNLGRRAARTIVLGDFDSEVPAVQESLF
jgi:hypothetical protein